MSTLFDNYQQVPRVRAADEVAIRTVGFKCVSQRHASHDMSAAYLQGGIDAESDFHACSALNIHLARVQSSGVSMSCTRCRGNNTGTAAGLKIIRPCNQASARPQ